MSSLFDRVSVRTFTEEPLEQDHIDQLMRAAMAAPSAGNQQPWEFYLIDDVETLEALSRSTQYAAPAKGAALAIVPCYRTEGLRFPDSAQLDMSAATENILIQAAELGLGAVWLGIAPGDDAIRKVAEILSVPEDQKPFCIIACGYPDNARTPADRYDAERVHRFEPQRA